MSISVLSLKHILFEGCSKSSRQQNIFGECSRNKLKSFNKLLLLFVISVVLNGSVLTLNNV